jgi:hypothetical protein
MELRDNTPNPRRAGQISIENVGYIALRPCENAPGDLHLRLRAIILNRKGSEKTHNGTLTFVGDGGFKRMLGTQS